MMAQRPKRIWLLLTLGVLSVAAIGSANSASAADLTASIVTTLPALRWSTVSSATAPPPFANASAVYDSDNEAVVLFGGRKSDGTLSDNTWVLDGSSWIDYLRSATGAPPTRQLASMAYDATPSKTTSTAARSTSPGTPSSSPPLSANSHVLRRGDLVTLAGAGFRPGSTIVITFHSTPVVVGRAVANAKGGFSATVAVPEAAAGGGHHFEAVGVGRTGSITELTSTIEVVGVPEPGSRPSSLQRWVLLVAALAIPVGTWCFLIGAGWWRRRHLRAT